MSEVKVRYVSPAGIVSGVVGEDETPDQHVDGDFEPSVTIDEDGIEIGDVFLPRQWIAENGVTVRQGFTELRTDGITRLEHSTVTVTFLVGDISVHSDTVDHVHVLQRVSDTIPRALEPLDGIPGEARTMVDGLLRVATDPDNPNGTQVGS